MINLKEKIKAKAKKNDIDMIGFANKERFEGLDARYNPFSIFPDGKTVIIIGQRITRGTLRGVEEGTNFQDYRMFGYTTLDDEFTALACYDITCAIEDEGYEAVPVFPNPPEIYGQGIAVKEGAPAPNIAPDFTYAAVACGLGEIGMHGEFLTRQFGTRQRFQMIITDAQLEPDEILNESICQKCGKCAEICPLCAIDINSVEESEICGKKLNHYKVDYSLCRKCKNGAVLNRLYPTGKPDRLAALCVRTCVCTLEEKGVLSNTFENKFRKRDAWAIDIYGKSLDTKDLG